MPTILRPKTAIIAIGEAHTVAEWDAKHHKFEPAQEINFSISADHRVLDGATVARFATQLSSLSRAQIVCC